MKIPYDRVLVQPFQYTPENFEHVPEIEGHSKPMVHVAAVMVANVAGINALSNPARTYCFNVLSQNAWSNADFDTIVGMVCNLSAKKTKLGAYVAQESALHSSADEVLMLYTCSLVMSHEGVRGACPPSVKHTAAQNISSWLSLKQEFPTMYNAQYAVQIMGYNNVGQPMDQYGNIVPPHLVPQQMASPYQGHPSHMVGVNGHPMQAMHPQYGTPYVPTNTPVFSGAPNVAAIQAGVNGAVQPYQPPQPPQLYAQRPPSQYMQPAGHQRPQPQAVQKVTQIPTSPEIPVQQVTQVPTQVAAAPAPVQVQTAAQTVTQQQQPTLRFHAHTHSYENRVLVCSRDSILESPMERKRHLLTKPHEDIKRQRTFGGGLADYGQIQSAEMLVDVLHSPGMIIKRRQDFADSIIYANSVEEAAGYVSQYSKGDQYMQHIDKSNVTPEMKSLVVVMLRPVTTFFDCKETFALLSKQKSFKEYQNHARMICKGSEDDLIHDPENQDSRLIWQDNVLLIEAIDRLMTSVINTYLGQSLHTTINVDSLLQDYDELVASLNASGAPGMVRDMNEKIATIFKNIFSEVDQEQKDFFAENLLARPGVENIAVTMIPTVASFTYMPLMVRSLGVKITPEYRKIVQTTNAHLHKFVREIFDNIDGLLKDKPEQTPVLNSYVVTDDGVVLEVYRSSSRTDSLYIRTVG